MELSRATFDELSSVIHRLCGIVVSQDKEYLIRDRLAPVIAERGLQTYDNLCVRLKAGLDDMLVEAVINAVTTRETSFFRDPHVFLALQRDLFPRLVADAAPGRKVRIWSAGVSQGQEAYSLAMTAIEYGAGRTADGRAPISFSVLATDISTAALRAAQTGEYEARDVARGISPARAARFFATQHGKHRVTPAVRSLVEFRQLNLCSPLVGLGTFDLICCRNVLIYFDLATRQRIVQGLHAALRPGGWLLLGTAENLYGIAANFESVRLGEAMFYRRLPTAAATT